MSLKLVLFVSGRGLRVGAAIAIVFLAQLILGAVASKSQKPTQPFDEVRLNLHKSS